MQVAFTLPLDLPIVLAATLYRLNWFYPAFMIALGTHYLPFVFLYGMRQFAILAAVLIGASVIIGMYFSSVFSLGGESLRPWYCWSLPLSGEMLCCVRTASHGPLNKVLNILEAYHRLFRPHFWRRHSQAAMTFHIFHYGDRSSITMVASMRIWHCKVPGVSRLVAPSHGH